MKALQETAIAAPAASTTSTPTQAAPAPAPVSVDWSALCDKVDQSGQLRIAQIMRDWLRLIELKPLSLTFAVAEGYPGDPTAEVRDGLLRATGERWEVRRAEGEAMPSLRELSEAAKAAEKAATRASPLVAAALAVFPGAEFVEEERPAHSGGQNNRSRYA